MTFREAQHAIRARLRPVAGEDALIEATILLEHVGATRTDEVTKEHTARLLPLIERRTAGEPLQYVLGTWRFYGLPFFVDPRVLIPRPDTEILVEEALKELCDKPGATVLDVCTGSGCIGLTLAKKSDAIVTLSDLSEDALSVAKANAKALAATVHIVRSDLFSSIEGQFDLITCNPPYLSAEEMARLDRSVRYEPALALDGGEDGLAMYRRIREGYRRHLKPNGLLLIEIGYEQGEAVCAMFSGSRLRKDYGGRPRVVMVRNDA